MTLFLSFNNSLLISKLSFSYFFSSILGKLKFVSCIASFSSSFFDFVSFLGKGVDGKPNSFFNYFLSKYSFSEFL